MRHALQRGWRRGWRTLGRLSLSVALAGCLPVQTPVDRHGAPAVQVGESLGLSTDEVESILAHGPWPMPFKPDPGNRVSGQPAAIELGRQLFNERGLSADARMACSTCHRIEHGFAEPRARSLAGDGSLLDRNAQSLLDVRTQHWFGWDGAADSLWAFILRPLNDPRELNTSGETLRALFKREPNLSCLREAAFGTSAPAMPDIQMKVEVAKALAAYLETLDSPRSRFDDFRDALARGDLRGARAYPADALRGLRRFVGDGRCNLCHLGPGFSNGEFHDIGRPFMVTPGRPDPGRHGGIRTVLADPFNRLGAWSDGQAMAGADDPAVRTRHLDATHRNYGEFKVPGLRGAARTAPYFHDGSAATLLDTVNHYSQLDPERLHADGESLLRPLKLSADDTRDLLAFLQTLSEPSARAPESGGARRRPAPPHGADGFNCPGPARARP